MNLPYFDLKGKVAIITGGATGIGRGIAEGLADAGASIVLCARRMEVLEQAASVMRVLAHPHRLRICELLQTGNMAVGALAEYVIHYVDGQQQVVPLIAGRTTDDWSLAPEADQALPALKGDPWHLNVLGVTLRPAPVEKVVFRDLGTPAAPVLAAMTLEK